MKFPAALPLLLAAPSIVSGQSCRKTGEGRLKGDAKISALVIAAVLAFAAAPPAVAERMTFDDYWKEAHQKPGVVIKEYPKATVVTDEENQTVYLFTKPGNPAHPGVMVRKLINDTHGAYFDTEGHSDGPDSAQPAFKAWMANPLQ
jgi:hypothetical protein